MRDLTIIGGSAAAITAGIYAARRGLNFVVVAKEFGGEVATSGEVGNWPGVQQTDGFALAKQFKDHLDFYKAPTEDGVLVESIVKGTDGIFTVSAKRGDEALSFQSRAVIVATGVHPRELGVPGEKEFRNKGVSYCTTCDGPIFSGKITATVGGGNSALESALMLADIASHVYVINKNTAFKGDQMLIENLQKKQNVTILYNALTTRIEGDQFVKHLAYKDAEGVEHVLDVEGVFVHIGNIPNSSVVPSEVEKDAIGQIVVDAHCATNVSGLFAAGDVTNVPFNQIVIAAGQGCIAALTAVQYLNRQS
ncbi:MAG: FAD-dependent oxidoreductase [Patescibacteria group bacterium]